MFENRTKISSNWEDETKSSSVWSKGRDKISSAWGQVREFFYKTWKFGSHDVKFGSFSYTFGGTKIKEDQPFSQRDKISTDWTNN